MYKAYLTDHNIVHKLVQREVQRCTRKVSLLTGALTVKVATPWKHSVVLIIPLEQAPSDLRKRQWILIKLKICDIRALCFLMSSK